MKDKFFFFIYAFILFFSLPLRAENWVLGTTRFLFTSDSDTVVDSHIGTVLPQLILEQFSQKGVRTISGQEEADRQFKKLQTERLSLFLQLSKEEKVLDSLIFTKASASEFKKARTEQEKKIAGIKKSIDENIEKAKNIKFSENNLGENKTESIVLYKNDASAFFKPSQNAVYDGIESYGFENEISQASINGLLTGEITLYGDYISVAVHLYQFPGAKLSCSVIEVGCVSDLVSLAAMIARDLTPKIANSLPVKIVFEFENDKIFDEVDISIDGVLLVDKQNVIVDAGIHSVSVASQKYDTQNFSFLFSGEEQFTVKVKMHPKEKGSFRLNLRTPLDGLFYFNGGSGKSVTKEEPWTDVTVNGRTVLGIFTDKEGKSDFVMIPENSGKDGASLFVDVKPFDRAEKIDRSRKRMYAAYSTLICTLPFTFFCAGQVNSYGNSYNSSKLSQSLDSYKKWDGIFNGACAVSAAAGAWFIFEIARYLIAANQVLPEQGR